MSRINHENETNGVNKPYEENEIRLKGILGFGIGLVLLIIITFVLMYALLGVLKDNAKENSDPPNPMAMSEKERLPPEPRLQLAPGFGVESEKGRVNMELQAPSTEYKELRAQWDAMLTRGRKDEKSGAVTMMPIDEAKAKFLSQNVKARSGAEVEEFFKNSRSYISDSSSGRLASERRR